MGKKIDRDVVRLHRSGWTLKMIRDRCRVDEHDCWLWLQTTTGKGYPLASIDGRAGVSVRRWVWGHTHEHSAGKMRVVSYCAGGILCCNPRHLELSRSSTIAAMQWASRSNRTPTQSPRSNAKLTMAGAEEIRSDCRPAKTIAAERGLNLSHVYRIRRGESWARPTRAASSIFELAVAKS